MNKSVRKKSGDLVLFDPQKLRQSLLQSGASRDDAVYVSEVISDNLVDGMSTHKVYQMAYNILRKKSGKIAGRYRLKKAIFDMGPTGYPFELLVGELIRLQGYKAKTGIILDGQCVQHEVDVLAQTNTKTVFVECKFHNEIRRKSDVKVSLYVKSRFDDLRARWKKDVSENHIFEGWLVTNTRFTHDAIQYGSCAGLKMISWDYPVKGNLRQLIDEAGFHPITSMQTITKREKTFLMENDIILCRQLFSNTDILRKLGIKEKKILKIKKEAGMIAELV